MTIDELKEYLRPIIYQKPPYSDVQKIILNTISADHVKEAYKFGYFDGRIEFACKLLQKIYDDDRENGKEIHS